MKSEIGLSEEAEKVFTIPLGDAWKGSRLRRADAAVRIVKEYVKRHSKAENVKISPKVVEKIWENGRQNPPRRIRVVLDEEDEETVTVRLEGEKKEEEEEEE
ncbi:MAG: 50S ribosomal protein L31e [Candidatus Caldarchaeum sp.]|nr:50S ribosomal protein L31e [Candidatus Caldarchaeum sp.]MDW7977859.1 50S ribosomal protein L31e [Candidatus Caldarchaeum sp.]MDW8359783.1 50S ribosomal protein L31e [Candidatus Caldarchaeum sp.]